jgi:hypothetical protein
MMSIKDEQYQRGSWSEGGKHLCQATRGAHGWHLSAESHQVASTAALPASSSYEGSWHVLLQLHQLFLRTQCQCFKSMNFKSPLYSAIQTF